MKKVIGIIVLGIISLTTLSYAGWVPYDAGEGKVWSAPSKTGIAIEVVNIDYPIVGGKAIRCNRYVYGMCFINTGRILHVRFPDTNIPPSEDDETEETFPIDE